MSDPARPLGPPARLQLQPLRHAPQSSLDASLPALKPLSKAPLARPAAGAGADAGSGSVSGLHVAGSSTSSTGATHAQSELQQLLSVVRERYASTAPADTETRPAATAGTAAQSAATGSSASLAAASTPATPAAKANAGSSRATVAAPVSTSAVAPAAAAAVAAAAPSAASAAEFESTFSGAAALAQTDKLAILLAMFKSRGLAPPPLPMMHAEPAPPSLPPMHMQLEEEEQEGGEGEEEKETGTEDAPAVVSASTDDASTAASDRTAAEVAQLSALFTHARNKVLKLSRLYQSGVLKGSAGQQALGKLGALTRTYWAFIQQARSHAHMQAVAEADADIQGDVQCTSAQQLSERLFRQAQA